MIRSTSFSCFINYQLLIVVIDHEIKRSFSVSNFRLKFFMNFYIKIMKQGGVMIWNYQHGFRWCIHNSWRSRSLFIVSILMKTTLSRGTSVSRGIISVTWINFTSSTHMMLLTWIFEWTFHVRKIIGFYMQRNFHL